MTIASASFVFFIGFIHCIFWLQNMGKTVLLYCISIEYIHISDGIYNMHSFIYVLFICVFVRYLLWKAAFRARGPAKSCTEQSPPVE